MATKPRAKTGPRTVSLAAQPAEVNQNPALTSKEITYSPFESLGSTGTLFFSGLIRSEEYNPELEGDQLLRTTQKMWRSDPQIAALMQVLMLPLLRATWTIDAASEEQFDVDVAQFVTDNLMGGMQRSWAQTLEFVLLEWLRDGFAVLEKVYIHGDDGKIRLAKLAPRISKSIYRWYPGPDDTLDRIQQRVWRPDDDGISGTYIYPVIPAAKLVVFSHMMEGNDWSGTSILRPAYKPWYMKDQLERLACVAAERLAAGVPVFSEPQGPVQKSDRDNAMHVLTSLYAHEKAAILEPFGWAFRFESGTGMDLLPLIEYMGLQIVRAVLAQFLNLDRGGSYALSQDVSTFFLQALEAKGEYLAEQFQAQVIKPLVDLNFKVERYPTMAVTGIDRRNVDKFLVGLGSVLSSNFLTKNVETENAIRKILDLPDLPADASIAGGGAPSVDTDSQGQTATAPDAGQEAEPTQAENVEQAPPAGTDVAYSMPVYPEWVQDTVAELLTEKPDGLSARAWRDICFAQATEMAMEELTVVAGKRRYRSRVTELAKGDPSALISWFNDGAAGRISWGDSGDWQQCVDVASEHMSEEDARGFCELRHQDATGMSTSEHAHQDGK